MSRQFLISGLPRCRTAWLSVASTTAQSFCYHEPVPRLESFEAMEALWKPVFGHSAGISDSCLSLQLERILEVVKPRTLLVERPIEDIIASFRRYLADTHHVVDDAVGVAYLRDLQREIDRFRDHPLVRTMAFCEMTDYSKVLVALKWLVPETDFPDLHGLMRMNIQVDRDYCVEMAARPHNGWHRIPWSTSQESSLA